MVGVVNYVARIGGLCLAAGLGLAFGGCATRAPEPASSGRFRPTPVTNTILDSLGIVDEPGTAWEKAQDPKPRDVLPVRNEGLLQPGDTVRISIFELLREGVTETNDYLISDTGKLSLPEVGPVRAGGLTELQLEQEIKKALVPGILKNPLVSVRRISSQPQMFAILGAGVTQPGRYVLPMQPYRLTDALAAAGLAQFNVSHVYIARSEQTPQPGSGLTPGSGMELIEPQTKAPKPKPSGDAILPPVAVPSGGVPQPSQPAEKFETQQELLDLIMPSAKATPKREGEATPPKNDPPFRALASNEADVSPTILPGGFRLLTPAQTVPQTNSSREDVVQSFTEYGGATTAAKPPAGDVRWVFQDGQWVPVPGAGAQTTNAKGPEIPQRVPDRRTVEPSKPEPGQSEWVFQDGRWVQVRGGRTESTQSLPAIPPVSTLPLDNERLSLEAEPDLVTQSRLIKVPTDRLLAGDPKYNVVIRPGDVIHVPVDIVGEFCITGNVVHSGYFSMTGRVMTLKQAIAAAGGFKSLPGPKYCEVVRRIAPMREVTEMIDLEAVLRGERPDVIIKPNDLINVGTYPSAERSGP